MKGFIRAMCLSICTLMLLGVLVACKNDPVSNEESEESVSDVESEIVESTETEKVYQKDENGYVMDELPDTTYNGEKIRVLGWKGNERFTIPTDSGGGNVQLYSQIYFHRLSVEARLDIQLDVNYMEARGDDPGSKIRSAFTTEVMSGAGDYDLIQTYSLYPATLAQEGLLVNINKLKYPQLDMPWWPDAISEWEQYDALYFVANNSSALAIRSMFVMYSYTDMIIGSGLVDPVELVIDGKWTVEKMMEYAKNFHGDAVANPGEIYGLVVDDHSRTDALYYGAGFHSTLNDANGVAKATWSDASYRARVGEYLEQLITFFKLEEVEIAPNSQALMKEKKTALMLASMGNVDILSDNDYAPIPIPKYDEEAEYCTMQNNGYDMWCVPKTTDNAELSGIVLEAISSSEYRKVAPFYFDTVLKDRYSQDANGVKVFDIIRGAVVYDFGRLCQFTMSDTVEYIWRRNFVTGKVKDPKNILESNWATSGVIIESALMELQADFRNNNR